MKKTIIAAMASIALVACSPKADITAVYDIVPLPASIQEAADQQPFVLSSSTKIVYPAGDEALQRDAQFLGEYLQQMTGLQLKITDKKPAKDAILLGANLDNANPEAYLLTIDNDFIAINGASPAGTFYGIQTLRKSIPEVGKHNVAFPAVTIADAPRFGYRGVHLDVSRHFFPADSIKQYIDILALHNVNTMHWHLSDDQGWRIEIEKYPELTAKGSIRPGTCVGKDLNSCDSVPYGGYYTKEEARDIVKYAADRHITVMPEIDMPGHMLAALKAYPQLGCTGGPYEVWTRWGIADDVLCASNDSVYAFLEDVLDEIVDIFPSQYIHIGGDECPKVRWAKCPKCQAKIKELGLKDEKGMTKEQKLQTQLMNRMAKHLSEKGRKAVGWDEILEGGATPDAVIMSWRGFNGARKAAQMGHDAIMTPTSHCYFDYMQAPDSISDEIQLPYATLLTLEKVYSLEPVDSTLTADEAKHILGAQCNVWTEYIPTFDYAQYKLMPRVAAMSEVQWTSPEDKNYEDFLRRLSQLTAIYDALGYHYATFGIPSKPGNTESRE